MCMCVVIIYAWQGGTDNECEVITSKKTGYLTSVCMETYTERSGGGLEMELSR